MTPSSKRRAAARAAPTPDGGDARAAQARVYHVGTRSAAGTLVKSVAEGICARGFRKWCGHRLIEAHPHLVTAFPGPITVLAAIEQGGPCQGWRPLLSPSGVTVGLGALETWNWRRTFAIMGLARSMCARARARGAMPISVSRCLIAGHVPALTACCRMRCARCRSRRCAAANATMNGACEHPSHSTFERQVQFQDVAPVCAAIASGLDQLANQISAQAPYRAHLQ